MQFDTGWAVYIEKCKTQNTCRNSYWSWCYVLWVNNCLSVNSQQAVTSHPSHSITDCVNGLSAIPAMYQPQELEQLIEPNKEATKRVRWRVTSPCNVQSGTSLHLLQKQHHNSTCKEMIAPSFKPGSSESWHGSCCICNVREKKDT